MKFTKFVQLKSFHISSAVHGDVVIGALHGSVGLRESGDLKSAKSI